MLNNISGFPELLPHEQIVFNKLIDRIKQRFELHGFIPMDTPAVERVSTLLEKGNDTEIYGLHRLADDGGAKDKDLALRFDLTVPLARYVSQHHSQLAFPFRRYQIAPVWRGERPQAGRYRQFFQCDIDIVGDEKLNITYDAEVLYVIHDALIAIGLTKKFIIKINNRLILTGIIKSFDIEDQAVAGVMRIIDKAEKISRDTLIAELRNQGIANSNITLLLGLIDKQMTNKQWLEYLKTICNHPEFIHGLQELQLLISALSDFGMEEIYIQINPTLARGLNYYTGTVAEIKLINYPEMGSICGGGRYANLTAQFGNKQLPGVGFSIGLSRLIPKLIEIGIAECEQKTTAPVLVTAQNSELMPYYIKIAQHLRKQGIGAELYLAEKNLGAQMKYANKKGFKFVIIADNAEAANGKILLRTMSNGNQILLLLDEVVDIINPSFGLNYHQISQAD